MELLYISSVDISRPSGPGVNEAQFVISAAIEYGPEAHFILPSPESFLPKGVPLNQVTFLPRLNRRSVVSRITQQAYRAYRALQFLACHNVDYVVFRADVLPVAEYLIAKKSHSSFAKTVGGGDLSAVEGRLPKFASGFVARLHKNLWRRFCKSLKCIDVVSEIHRRKLEKSIPESRGLVAVFDNAVDTEMFALRSGNTCKAHYGLMGYRHLIGYIGNLADSRGGTELLLAWKHIGCRDDVGIVVVSGDGVGLQVLRAKANQLGIGDRLFLLGPVALEDVPVHMSMLDVGVSFRDEDGCSELKVRQYLACGVPVVVSASINGFVRDHRLGVIVSRSDIAGIGAAITSILSSPESYARERIAKFAAGNLSYSASIKERRRFWREKSQS